MKNTIIALWNGELCPADDFKITDEYRELQQKLVLAEEKLMKNADDKMKENFEEFEDALNHIGFIDEKHAFCRGFSLGVKLVFEALG